jgi:ribosomal protein S18 acetylase RimI-like enzyme
MFDVSVHFDDISISSVLKEDIISIQKWMNLQKFYEDEALSKPMTLKELEQRFIEYYMSENEFFLKIDKGERLIGIFKGRVEFKYQNEALVWCYILDDGFRGIGLGSKVLNEILSYFKDNFGITNFSTSIVQGNTEVVRFWKRNKFRLARVSKGFFNVEGKSLDMLILKRE